MNEIVQVTAELDFILADGDRRRDRVVKMWIDNKLSAHTRRNYRLDISRLFEFAAKPVSKIGLEDLQNFAAHLESKKLAASSRKRILAAVKSFFSFASDDGIRFIPYNVAAAIRLPKPKENRNARTLTREQLARIVGAAKAGRDRLIVELLYLVGLRAEELQRLTWADLAIDSHGGGWMTVFGKGDKTRNLKIDPPTWKMLMDFRTIPMLIEQLPAPVMDLAIVEQIDAMPIFLSRLGSKISTVQIWRIVAQAARRAGIHASPHFLRHAHATIAIEDGCDLRKLQLSLGHASSDTTEKYIHARPAESSGAFVKRIEPIVSAERGGKSSE